MPDDKPPLRIGRGAPSDWLPDNVDIEPVKRSTADFIPVIVAPPHKTRRFLIWCILVCGIAVGIIGLLTQVPFPFVLFVWCFLGVCYYVSGVLLE